jgi:uncharacterized tellurite resistance protein B-like protein
MATMFDFLRNLLAPAPPPRDEPDAPLAAAALLAEVAQADGDEDAAEMSVIEASLCELFDLDRAAARDLRRRGAAARADAADLVRFTRAVKTGMETDARYRLMRALWAVALTDGQRDPHEDAALRKIAPLIALTDRDSAMARREAEATA